MLVLISLDSCSSLCFFVCAGWGLTISTEAQGLTVLLITTLHHPHLQRDWCSMDLPPPLTI